MTAGFIASFGSVALVFALLYAGAYLLTRRKPAAPVKPDIRTSLDRVEAAVKAVESELARIRNAIAS